MDFDTYQQKSQEFDLAKATSDLCAPGFIEKVLGLVGEAGETADKVKKLIRDKNDQVSEEDKAELVKELGDTLWYIANIARYLEVPLSEVAQKNLDKLTSRKNRNLLHGTGDNR